jgi:DNA modification methylase
MPKTEAKLKPEVHCAHDAMVDTSALVPNSRNPNQHPQNQLILLSKIIAVQGWRAPITVSNRSGFIVRGHGRLQAAQILELEQCPVDYQDYDTEADEWADMLADNRLAELAETNFSTLADVLLELDSIPNFDLDLTGFDAAEVKQMMHWTPPGTAEDDDFDSDAALESAPTRVKRGEVWQLGKHRVMCGDSTSAEDVERLMGGAKAVVYATDPPYAVDYVEKARDMNKRGYGHSRAKSSAAIQGDCAQDGKDGDIWRGAFEQAKSIALAEHAAWYVWFAAKLTSAMFAVLDDAGFLHHQTIIWVKNNFVIGRSDYQWMHEPCYYGWIKGSRPPFLGARNQTTVWDVSRDAGNKPEHPTQKPVELFARAIANHATPGEAVFDSFLGSGTTLIAAEQLGRVCYGMEISEKYCTVVLMRWEALTGKQAILCEDIPPCASP